MKKREFSRQIISLLLAIASVLAVSVSYADQDPISLFPLSNYNQSISAFIKPTDADYDKPLLSADMQQKRLEIFLSHYVGPSSPWNADYVNRVLRQSGSNSLKAIEQHILNNYSNEDKSENEIGYSFNFRPYAKSWIEKIAQNVNTSQLDSLSYQSSNRGIAVDNLQARGLPTADPHFYHHKIAGQGYPFDNLQISALWAGTPVYIIADSRDHAWMLVLTPDYIGWVKSIGIARVDNAFVSMWDKAARENLAAITRTQTALVDEKGTFHFSAYVGAVYPAHAGSDGIQLMLPVADMEHNAVIKYATVSSDEAAMMPLVATPHHFADLIETLIGRPYGWGGMNFNNDCSAELKSLLTPFAIWVPRHSSDQMAAGKMVDMTAASPEKRLLYLKENGEKFLTLIYLGGHVVMYVGNQSNKAMTYQNIWGLSPNPSNRRAVIGQSVLFPMLLQYPEDGSLVSLANKKFFQVTYLSQIPDVSVRQKMIDLKSLMYPDYISYFVNT